MDSIKQVLSIITWVLHTLRDAEHAVMVKEFITFLPPKLTGVTVLLTLLDAVKAQHVREESALKRVSHAAETNAIKELHRKRIDFFLSVKLTVEIAAKSRVAVKVQAAEILMPLLRAYKHIGRVGYDATTSLIENFLLDLTKPQYSASAAALNLAPITATLQSSNTELHQLWLARLSEIGMEMTIGNVRQTRPAVDRAVMTFVRTLDGLNYSNETVTKDPALKAKLEDAILFINSEVHARVNTLGHRGVKHPHPGSFFYDEIPALPPEEEGEEDHPSMGEH
ncbi:MAG: DUF6261 family protein [Tannerellaceae bacterium]|jgi:hypothetical protein|nr:DUF6261 family protein [Tannerellaceae bacterium]